MSKNKSNYAVIGDHTNMSARAIWRRKRYFTKRFIDTTQDLNIELVKENALNMTPPLSIHPRLTQKQANIFAGFLAATASAIGGTITYALRIMHPLQTLPEAAVFALPTTAGLFGIDRLLKHATRADGYIDFLKSRNHSRIAALTRSRDLISSEYGPDVYIQDAIISLVAQAYDRRHGVNHSIELDFLDGLHKTKRACTIRYFPFNYGLYKNVETDFTRVDINNMWSLIDEHFKQGPNPTFEAQTFAALNWALAFLDDIQTDLAKSTNDVDTNLSINIRRFQKNVRKKKSELEVISFEHKLSMDEPVTEGQIAELEAKFHLPARGPSEGRSRESNGIATIDRLRSARIAKPPRHAFQELV